MLMFDDGLCCNFQPCDAAEGQEPTTQEKEESTHELVDSNNGAYYSKQHIKTMFFFLFHAQFWNIQLWCCLKDFLKKC